MNKAMDMAASKRRTASSYRRDYAKVSAGLSEGAKTVFRIDHDTQAMYRNGASQRTPIKPIPRAQ